MKQNTSHIRVYAPEKLRAILSEAATSSSNISASHVHIALIQIAASRISSTQTLDEDIFYSISKYKSE